MSPTQSNTQPGFDARSYNSGQNLDAMEGRLAKIVDGGSIPEALLPTAVTDVCQFVIDDGGAEDTPSGLLPLTPGYERRALAKGTGSAGDVLVLAAIAGADIGKVRAQPATPGAYFSPGTAGEDFVDGQLVRFNPLPRIVVVPAVIAAPATTTTVNGAVAGLNSTAVNPTKADFDALLTAVELIADEQRADNAKLIALHSACVAAGFVVTD